MTDLQNLRQQYRADKKVLLQTLDRASLQPRSMPKLLRELAKLADQVLVQLWVKAGLTGQAGASLLAVGGFGRGELQPYSDVDVLILLPDSHAADSALQKQVESFIGYCWDAGLEIGSSVRTLQECLDEAAKDVTVQTALLENRLITGNPALAQQFQAAFMAAMDAKAFFTAKTLEMHQRHTKFEETPYALEPNCKESPGGQRDLQVLLWVAKAACFGNSWRELAANGLATPYEARMLERNEQTLALIRAKLHWIAQRREDRLIFDLQTAVAESFGYRTEPPGKGKTHRTHARASEQLMRRYYWTAKAVTQLNQVLLLNIEERLHPGTHHVQRIDDCFNVKAGMIDVASDDLYQQRPHAILQTFLVFQQVPGAKGLSARTLRALYNARHVMDAAFRNDPVNHDIFMRILREPRGITHALRLMNQTSVLGRYLWVFRQIVGQMQHDLFHVYTVDQHILMVLRNVRRFFMDEHAHEYPFCSQLAAGWEQPWILYVAALFHDIAKGRGGDHSELGAKEVRRFCKQHRIDAEDTALIEFLVREHLTMSQIAQKTDLSDPEVIAGFAKRVGSERYLTALYLLTVADIRGTSPKVWNAWKGKLLDSLYRQTTRAMGGYTPDPDAEIEQRKREALTQIALHSLPFEAHKPLWDTLDVGYFMRHEASDIAWHTKHLSRLVNTQQPVVRARRSSYSQGLQVLVYTPDQADLFARICGYFEQNGYSILDAQIHTTQHGYALDTFELTSIEDLNEHFREAMAMLENGLSRVIADSSNLPTPSRGRVSRRVKSFPIAPRITLKPDEKRQRWVLNLTASDRIGLLYSVARVLAKHGIAVQMAKVATLGELVEDTFLIHGPSLQHNKTQIDIETELLQALGQN